VQITQFATTARSAGAWYVGIEHGTGYPLVGGGRADYAPGGAMRGYDLILGEFDDDRFDDTVWQILARYLGPAYHRPAVQPPSDDPGAPFAADAPQFLLAETSPGGPYVYRVFEYYIYGGVRGADPTHINDCRQKFVALGATGVC